MLRRIRAWRTRRQVKRAVTFYMPGCIALIYLATAGTTKASVAYAMLVLRKHLKDDHNKEQILIEILNY